jgi:galactokinase
MKRFPENDDFLVRIFGDRPALLESKRRMLETVRSQFEHRFGDAIEGAVHLVAVPNRVELLGKHTDYQGGDTLVLTGSKNFFALAASASDGVTHLVNGDPDLGETVLKVGEGAPEMMREGVGSNYTYRVAARLTSNLLESGLSPPGNVKAVFLGDIPIGGGTSGSSAKVITDFLIFTATSGLIESRPFRDLIVSNGSRAGLRMNQEGLDDFALSLSMYIAHYENGLDFGDLRGDRGVGTFGGSEDHTAIVLGRRDELLFCRYCPTELLARVAMPPGYSIVVGYSGKRAEKTKDAMQKYNRLSEDARGAVRVLNELIGTECVYLRDCFPDLPPRERADAAREQLMGRTAGATPAALTTAGPADGTGAGESDLAGRAYQFFREQEIVHEAVGFLGNGEMGEYGRLINVSHELSREYLKNIAPEVDGLQKAANELGALGATGFGGGFGGCCYAVVEEDAAEDFLGRWRELYVGRFPRYRAESRFDVYPACRGASWASLG